MSRRSKAGQRQIALDPKYSNMTIARLINRVMLDGQKNIAEKIVYSAMTIIEKQETKEPVMVVEQAIRNATPQLEVKSRRIGGATYQVPIEVRPVRGLSLALRWLIIAARSRSGKSMAEKLAGELSDAARGQGTTVKKRDDTHRMAEANRAFAHYKW